MRTLSNGKRVRSESEWREIFRSYRVSGLSRAAFCKREGIAIGSFSNWEKRLKPKARPSSEFVEWSPPAPPPTRTPELELSLPGGVTLRWKL